MPDEMEEIMTEFVTESEEALDQVDPLFVELEAKGRDQELLNRIFRCVHTIKGAAGFLGFQPIVDVAHNAENIMKKLRDNEIALSRPLMDVILKSVDMLRTLLRNIRSRNGAKTDVGPLVKELVAALANARSAGTSPAAPAAGPRATPQAAAAPDRPAAASHAEMPFHTPAPERPAPVADEPSASPSEGAGPAPSADRKDSLQTLRVEVEKIDKVLNLTGEVVLVRNRLLNLMNRLETRYNEDRDVGNMLETVSFLDLIASDMQLAVMKMRMQPLQKVFNKFPRLVRDIAGPLGKQVELLISGEETEVDKSVIEQIGDPLVHIIRNAVDHGLETPAERAAAGKAATGVIGIAASQKGNQIIIEITDDGRGVDLKKVRRKAAEKGLASADEAARMTDEAAINLLFLPGFSTADKATELSGRGVGMDVVKTNIAKLNGAVEVSTVPGKGTTFLIRLPLTLAIIQTLMVRAGDSRYAVPLAPVEETLKMSDTEVSEIGGAEALVIRGRVYPLFTLAAILNGNNGRGSRGEYAVVVAIGETRFCLGVDDLLGQEEVVIKTVSGINAGSSYLLGATITGEGKVVFILDLASLAKTAMGIASRPAVRA